MLSSDVATGLLMNGADIFILGCRLQAGLWLLVHLVSYTSISGLCSPSRRAETKSIPPLRHKKTVPSADPRRLPKYLRQKASLISDALHYSRAVLSSIATIGTALLQACFQLKH